MTDSNHVFPLDRLYTGANGQGRFDQVSRTPGVDPDQLAECRRLANLLPPLPAQRTEEMPGALGLFRGESIDYILAKAQQGANGAPQLQYILVPTAPLRSLGGNIRTFEGFACEPIPQFAVPRTDLAPFVLENPQAADEETQIDDLLALLSHCKNNMKIVSGLTAALVQSMGIGIVNAPFSMRERLTFIQGLLTLLPAAVRTRITFATSVIDPSQTNVQIKFLAADIRPARHLIYDWEAGKLLTDAPTDTYADFMITQFRLDPSLVLKQTQQMEPIAIWRMRLKDDLPNALAWAAKRISLDTALKNGLPGDPQMVSVVLHDDPTLVDDMRVLYARHLLSFTLALDEVERGDALADALAKNQSVADAIFEQLRPAAESKERATAVYHLIARWLSQVPNLDGARWRPLLATAALTRANAILATDDAEALRIFLESFLDVAPTLQLERAMAHVIGVSRKIAYRDEGVARALFLVAVTFLPAGGLQRLLTDTLLTAQLPDALRAVFPQLAPDAPRPAPHGLLARAAAAFTADRRPVVLARLAEWALLVQRADLIDADVLQGLIEVGSAPLGIRFHVLSQHIVEDLSRLPILRALDVRSVQYLVALSLVRERFNMAITQLEYYQNMLYKGGSPEQLGKIVRQLFQETPLTIAQLTSTFDVMQTSQLRTIIRAQAYFGALTAKQWSPDTAFIAHKMTAILSTDASLIPLIGFDPTLRLIKANAERHNVVDTLRLASALVENALLLGENGGALVDKTYAMLNWGPEVAASAQEVLRTYVRRAPIEQAKGLAERIGKRQGEPMMRIMDATYRLRILLGGSDFASFTELVTTGVELLSDMAATYHESQETPPIHKLRRTVEGMPGGLSDVERTRLANNCFRIAEQILQLAKLRTHTAPRQDVLLPLIQNTIAPASGVDALHWIGGHFAYNQLVSIKLERADPPFLMGSRSVNILLRETDALVILFDNLLAAFPTDAVPLDNSAFRAEVESVWALLPLYAQRQTLTKLGENAQFLADLITVIGDKGHERSLAVNGYGRQLATGRAQPRSVIDALRWINGYFLKQHIG